MTKIIKHYGVKGMQWGVRRKSSSRKSGDYMTSRKIAKKKVSELSNKDLKKLAGRMNLEKQYSSLNPRTSSKGKHLVSKVLEQYGRAVVGGAVGAASTATVAALIKKAG